MKLLSELLADRKKRNVVILTILFVILGTVIYFQFFNQEKIQEGALCVVMCPECKDKTIKRIKDINDPHESACNCDSCHGKLGYGWKCEDCGYEYAVRSEFKASVKEMKTMAKFQLALEHEKCPNCASTRAHPISVSTFTK